MTSLRVKKNLTDKEYDFIVENHACSNCHRVTDGVRNIGSTKTNHPYYTRYGTLGKEATLHFIIVKCHRCGFEFGKAYINTLYTRIVMPKMENEKEHDTYLREKFLEVLDKYKCKKCGRVLIYNQRRENRSDYCDACEGFIEHVKKQRSIRTMTIDLGIPESPSCIECGKEINLIFYLARKNAHKDDKCLECHKKDVESGKY